MQNWGKILGETDVTSVSEFGTQKELSKTNLKILDLAFQHTFVFHSQAYFLAICCFYSCNYTLHLSIEKILGSCFEQSKSLKISIYLE